MESNQETGNFLADQLSPKLAYIMALVDEANETEESERAGQYAVIYDLIHGDEDSETLLAAVVRALEEPADTDNGHTEDPQIAQNTPLQASDTNDKFHNTYVSLPCQTFGQLHRALRRCGIVIEPRGDSKHFLAVNVSNGNTTHLSMHTGSLPPHYVGNLLRQLGITPQEYLEQK